MAVRSTCWMLFLFGLLFCACEDSGAVPPGSTAGYMSGCETGGPPATSGDDYGEPWEDIHFPEMPDDKLDVPASLPIESEPVRWERHTGFDIYYRSPTDEELADNDWLRSDHLLVIPKASTLSSLSAGNS